MVVRPCLLGAGESPAGPVSRHTIVSLSTSSPPHRQCLFRLPLSRPSLLSASPRLHRDRTPPHTGSLSECVCTCVCLCTAGVVDVPSPGRAAGYISFSRSPRVCTAPSGETGRNSFWMNGRSLVVWEEREESLESARARTHAHTHPPTHTLLESLKQPVGDFWGVKGEFLTLIS